MKVRDPGLVRRLTAESYAGYAVHRSRTAPLVDRVAACVALLMTMVVSGILLGSSTDQRRDLLGARRGRDSMPEAESSRVTR